MGKIVAGFGAPHSPSLPSVVAKTPDFVENALYANLRKQIEDVRADVVIMFSNDHFNTFFLDNFPLFAIGVADETSGPNDETPMPQHKIPLHQGLASHIHRTGISSGFDLTLSQEFTVDHAFAVPWHFIGVDRPIKLIPVFVNCFSNPLPLATRAHDLGRMIGSAVRTYKEDLRVAVFASGSFSLEIGGPQIPLNERSGVPDRKWMERIVELMRKPNIRDLIDEATPLQMARAGNAGGELLNWIAMLGCIGDQMPTELLPQSHGHAFGTWLLD